MRKDIKRLCVTNWGAVLELISPTYYIIHTPCSQDFVKSEKQFYNIIRVADPDAIDAGQYISLSEIKLVAKVKELKQKDQYEDQKQMMKDSVVDFLIRSGVRPGSPIIEKIKSL